MVGVQFSFQGRVALARGSRIVYGWLGVGMLLLFGGGGWADAPPRPDTQDPGDVSLSPTESLARMELPEGFRITLFAGEPDVRRPIAFDFDDRGRLWVVENYSHPDWEPDQKVDRVVILSDEDQDGVFDQRKVFWDQGRYLTGIAVGHGGVWLANTPELIFVPDRDGDDQPDGDPEVVLDGFARGNLNNCLNNFHWGPDGWLYGAIGLANDSWVGPPQARREERTLITRGIWRYHPARRTFEVLARGMVNPWGADFNEFGDLFTSNTVIAHLWHIVPGMYCQRRGFERDHPHAYLRVQSIADHLHWGGGRWQASRRQETQHEDAGGGHAHCGGMVYLGDNFPDDYRGSFFMGNLHGRRVNRDALVPRGSSYVGVHRDDFLFAHDDWFCTLSQKYGPDGGVYVTDWHDLGECHDKDGSHRSSGRIYKVVYGAGNDVRVDLARASSLQLADYHRHRNEWFVRHARRLMMERALAGRAQGEAYKRLRTWLADTRESSVMRLRCLWSLHACGQLTEPQRIALLEDEDPHVRRWAVRLLVDQLPVSVASQAAISRCASDAHPAVRLAVASAVGRFPLAGRQDALRQLLKRGEDASDPYLPAMIWYAWEPTLVEDVPAALRLAADCQLPQLQQFAARRLAAESPAHRDRLVKAIASAKSAGTQRAWLQGLEASLDDERPVGKPESWDVLYARLRDTDTELRGLAARIAARFGDRQAQETLQATVLDSAVELSARKVALTILLAAEELPAASLQQALLSERTELREQMLRALHLRLTPQLAAALLARYSQLTAAERELTISGLASSRDSASALLRAVRDGRIPKRDVSLYAVQSLRLLRDKSIQMQLEELWPANDDSITKMQQLRRYRELLSDSFLKQGDALAGRKLFDANCAKCHQLFGEGSRLAPDLTGSGRASLDYLLSNLVDPSGLVDPAYRLTTAITAEGRVVQGFIVKLSEVQVTLRTQQGQVSLDLDQVEDLQTSSISMMPTGLLEAYTDTQVRDLVKYLMSPVQVSLPE